MATMLGWEAHQKVSLEKFHSPEEIIDTILETKQNFPGYVVLDNETSERVVVMYVTS